MSKLINLVMVCALLTTMGCTNGTAEVCVDGSNVLLGACSSSTNPMGTTVDYTWLDGLLGNRAASSDDRNYTMPSVATIRRVDDSTLGVMLVDGHALPAGLAQAAGSSGTMCEALFSAAPTETADDFVYAYKAGCESTGSGSTLATLAVRTLALHQLKRLPHIFSLVVDVDRIYANGSGTEHQTRTYHSIW